MRCDECRELVYGYTKKHGDKRFCCARCKMKYKNRNGIQLSKLEKMML